MSPMARKASWEAQTRKGMLQAAREVFGEHGFAEASVADVVARAGSSVGSLYHHFGGKAELFLPLHEDHQAAHEQASATRRAAWLRADPAAPVAGSGSGRTPCCSARVATRWIGSPSRC
jgi:AcrR family transcriptional regulator